MTVVAPESAPPNATRIPSIVVLGADALLAALPATPVQLAHACTRAGYQSVVPASWGDELIAAASLRALSQHGQIPAIQCSCPHVAHRLLAVGTDLRPFLLSLVAPPVVLARYLRAAHAPGKLRITYVGRCPGAADESIDARLTPEELLAIFTDRQILVHEQPTVYDSVIPPDRRRYRSQPGGLPTPEMLWSATNGDPNGARSLVELYGADLPVELAQQLLAGKPVLIDCAPKLGCVCSGAVSGVDPADARAHVVALEPPRAGRPILDEQLVIDAALPLPASLRSAIDVVSTPAGPGLVNRKDEVSSSDERARAPRYEETGTHSTGFGSGEPTHGSSASTPPRRHSPNRGIARPATGALPTARDAEGRQLPRTYVAHRRAPSRTPRSGTPTRGLEPRGTDAPANVSTPTAGMPNDFETAADTPPGSSGAHSPEARPAPANGGSALVVDSILVLEEASVPQRSVPTGPNEEETRSDAPRYAERAVTLPVTPRSDTAPRQESAAHPTGERPVMQLLTLGLLISMIVLVSVAVGVLVGRWITQR